MDEIGAAHVVRRKGDNEQHGGPLHAAHALGAWIWQGGDSARLKSTTDGARYRLQVGR